MVEIKKVTDSYESIANLLNLTVENIEVIGKPLWIILDGDAYLVSYANEVFSIVNENTDIVSILNDQGEFRAYVENYKEYLYQLDETGVLASITDKNTKEREQLYYFTPTENAPIPILHYLQEKDVDVALLYDYKLPDRENNYFNYLSYLNNRYPDAIRYFYTKKILNMFKLNLFKDYMIRDDLKDNYSPCLISIDNVITILNTREIILREDLLNVFSNVGFNKNINPTLANIITQKDEKVRKIGIITKAYMDYNK